MGSRNCCWLSNWNGTGGINWGGVNNCGVDDSETSSSGSSDFGILLGDSPLDSVILHYEKSDLCMGLGDQVSKLRIEFVKSTSRGDDWRVDGSLYLLDNVDRLLDDLNWSRLDEYVRSVSRKVQLVGLDSAACAVELAGSDARGVEVVWDAGVESRVGSLVSADHANEFIFR